MMASWGSFHHVKGLFFTTQQCRDSGCVRRLRTTEMRAVSSSLSSQWKWLTTTRQLMMIPSLMAPCTKRIRGAKAWCPSETLGKSGHLCRPRTFGRRCPACLCQATWGRDVVRIPCLSRYFVWVSVYFYPLILFGFHFNHNTAGDFATILYDEVWDIFGGVRWFS
jgi:hypothetical protein